MTDVKPINDIVEQAKNRRAQTIGTAIEAYAIPAVLVAGLSLMLLQFSARPPVDQCDNVQVAQVVSADR